MQSMVIVPWTTINESRYDKWLSMRQEIADEQLVDPQYILRFIQRNARSIMQAFFDKGSWPLFISARHDRLMHIRYFLVKGPPIAVWDMPPINLADALDILIKHPSPEELYVDFMPSWGELQFLSRN